MGLEIIQAEAKSQIDLINKSMEEKREESKKKIGQMKDELKDMEKAFEKQIDSLIDSRKRFEAILNISDKDKNINKVLANKLKGSRKEKTETEEPKKKQGRPKKTEEVK